MSSLSSIARNSFKASLHAHSSATKLKSRFIWRFPSAKFDHLPSCTFKRLSSFGIQPITCDDELLQRQQLSILIYELGSHLNVYVDTSSILLLILVLQIVYMYLYWCCLYASILYVTSISTMFKRSK